jgi:hypothetical protein
MKAAEAQRIAHNIGMVKNDNQYKLIQSRIEIAANKGETSINLYERIQPMVRDTLINEEGYNVREFDSQREGYTATVSWNKILLG